jgi:SAM-dependent methyltransferase
LAFDAIAPIFDARFSEWQSVAAQRRAVRRVLLKTLPHYSRILELGGGTGEDAAWLAERRHRVLLTDPSPRMVALACAKLAPLGSCADVVAAEDLEGFAERYLAAGGGAFDSAFSNFAALNCVEDLAPVARGLAHLVKPGGSAILVLFGVLSPGDILVECLRGRPRQALRRFHRGASNARLGGQAFSIRYHRAREVKRAFKPWFRFVRRVGIGVFVPPSAAEPWISQHPRLLHGLEALDRIAGRPFAPLGDHVLYHFERAP